jgi:hypothetical protein
MEISNSQLLEKLLAKTSKVGGCFEWQGSKTKNGYVLTYHKGKSVHAHRLVFTLAKGPIPTGLVVMHSCDNRACINPEHLSVGSQSDNLLDAVAKGRNHQTKKTHCPKGHEYSVENTRVRISRGASGRVCLLCQNEYFARRREEKRQARLALPSEPVRQPLTHCKHGHEFTEANTKLVARAGRATVKVCRECVKRNSKGWYERNADLVNKGKQVTRAANSAAPSHR